MSLSVLGQLTGGNNICFLERGAFYPQQELFLFAQITVLKFSSVNLRAMFAGVELHRIIQYLSSSSSLRQSCLVSLYPRSWKKQPNMLTHMDTWYVWEPQKLYCRFSLKIYCCAVQPRESSLLMRSIKSEFHRRAFYALKLCFQITLQIGFLTSQPLQAVYVRGADLWC